MKEKIFFETITFNSGHALILKHKPEGMQMSQINDKLEKDPQDIHQFGLFDRSTSNYTTYYPEVTEDDLNPKDSEFIEPVFRMLSNVIVHAAHNPIYFPSDVLKKSMSKLIGQTIHIDHETAVGNSIGAVKNVEWQNAYTANGIKVPAGINATLKIDGKANPRIARGIMMDPPSIHSNSVTVKFQWKKSHPTLPDDEFFSKLGTFDDKGKLIHKIASDVAAYHETSLVSHGADPFAQKIKDGKIVNPSYASSQYELSDEQIKQIERANYIWDWKSLEASQYEEIIINTNGTTILETINNDNNQNSKDMEDVLRFLEIFFGLENEDLTEENYQEKLNAIDYKTLVSKAAKADDPIKVLDLEGLEVIENEVTTLRDFKKTVPENLSDQLAMAATGQVAINELKAETKRLYGLSVEEGKSDVSILAIIEGADYKTLKSLHKQYNNLTEGRFNFACVDCGSSNVTRASAKPTTDDDPVTKKTNQEVIDKFSGVNKVTLPSWMKEKEK